MPKKLSKIGRVLMTFCYFLVPLASFWPLQPHLDPPSASSFPKVAIWDDFWGHFGVTVDVILATLGAFFVA